ncbi:hypothetical protein E6H25_05555 [Candidatus Bathyarchaeota archaeon]|nr:MAG: hypothetical protein E6H25_05555 [Candidatus Bathyarchaeota archaeon]
MGQDVSSTIPAHLLIAAQHHGGLVLGAYDGRRMVGVLFGITALDNGRPYPITLTSLAWLLATSRRA